MKVRDKRILKNGTVAGYVYCPKEKKWKWRFLKGGRKKKKFKGIKIPTSKIIKNSYKREQHSNAKISNEKNMGLTEDNLNQIRYSEKYINGKGIKNRSKYRNTTYKESKDLKIRDVVIFHVQLFGRKYVLLGELHQYRHSEDLINYSNLIKMPIKMARTKRKCIDIYIENDIFAKPIVHNEEHRIVNQGNVSKKAESLTKLIRNLTKTENYQRHRYYRLHSFDTREYTKNREDRIMTNIFDLFSDMRQDGFNFDNYLIEIFTGRISDAIYRLLSDYSDHILESTEEEYQNINSENKVVKYINKKYAINPAYMYKYFTNLVRRINREYDKIPHQYKQVDISPVVVIENLTYKYLFMTDMYLFYRLLMDFNGAGTCPSYSETSFILGGRYHIENIMTLLNNFYEPEFEAYKFYQSMSINEYERFLNNKIFD